MTCCQDIFHKAQNTKISFSTTVYYCDLVIMVSLVYNKVHYLNTIHTTDIYLDP